MNGEHTNKPAHGTEDLVSRLRAEYVAQSARCGEEDSQERALLAQEAANEIERLTAVFDEACREIRMSHDTPCYCKYCHESQIDPSPWCSACGAMKQQDCHCGPIAENN